MSERQPSSEPRHASGEHARSRRVVAVTALAATLFGAGWAFNQVTSSSERADQGVVSAELLPPKEPLASYIIPAGSVDMPCSPGEVVNQVETDKKIVALTIDDGPSPETTPKILDVLGRAEARATFFVVSSRLQTKEGEQLARRILEEGHSIADHSLNHYLYDPDMNAADHSEGQEVLESVLGETPYAYRAPAFGYSDELKEAVESAEQCFIGMSQFGDSKDWEHDFLPKELALDALKKSSDVVIDNLEPGAIILTHDQTRDHEQDGGRERQRLFAADNIEYLLDGIHEAGYTTVTIDDLLQEG